MKEETASWNGTHTFAAFPSIGTLLKGCWTTLLTWQERARMRAALARLDDHTLKDIGLSRYDVWLECSKPFWKG